MDKLEVNNTTCILLESFEEWAGQPAHSSRFFSFYTNLLKLQSEVEQNTGIPEISLGPAEISQRLAARQILLRPKEMDIDWEYVSKVFGQVIDLFSGFPELLEGFPGHLSESQPELTPDLVGIWLEKAPLPQEISGIEIPPFVLSTLILQTMRPFLTGYALAFKGRYNQDHWRQGHCPVCGSVPAIAFLEKTLGARWLICSCCNMHWEFQRIDCAFCRNAEPDSLSFKTDDSGLYRIYLCEKCHHYLKGIDLRKTRSEVNLDLEILTSADLDRQAQEMGYISGELKITK